MTVLDVTGVLRDGTSRAADAARRASAPRTGADRPSARPTTCRAWPRTSSATTCRCSAASATGAVPGVISIAADMPGADFRTLLDAFNDRWVAAAGFFSPAVLIELLRVVRRLDGGLLRGRRPRVVVRASRSCSSATLRAVAVLAGHRQGVRRALGAPLADPPRPRAGVARRGALRADRRRGHRRRRRGRARLRRRPLDARPDRARRLAADRRPHHPRPHRRRGPRRW